MIFLNPELVVFKLKILLEGMEELKFGLCFYISEHTTNDIESKVKQYNACNQFIKEKYDIENCYLDEIGIFTPRREQVALGMIDYIKTGKFEKETLLPSYKENPV